MDKVKSIVTGDAYKKPAKTEAGAFTTQDSDNAHTTSGTSAEDPNIPGSGKLEQGVDKEINSEASKMGVPQSADKSIDEQVNKRI